MKHNALKLLVKFVLLLAVFSLIGCKPKGLNEPVCIHAQADTSLPESDPHYFGGFDCIGVNDESYFLSYGDPEATNLVAFSQSSAERIFNKCFKKSD